ncbi:hypothetical protein [Pseudomonas lactis]|uniref:hypothetical protein n=1 Tax=Pseudomonas lactis TaxID=1615674 RepID=UPI00307F584B
MSRTANFSATYKALVASISTINPMKFSKKTSGVTSAPYPANNFPEHTTMNRQAILGFAFSILAANVFADSATQSIITASGSAPLSQNSVAEGGADRLNDNRVAEGGADRLNDNRVAEGGADRLNDNRVAEGGADRLNDNRVAEGGADRLNEGRVA